MAEVTVKINSTAAREILKSEGVAQVLLEHAKKIEAKANKMGDGVFKADAQTGGNRAHARVSTTDTKARVLNAKHKTLLRCFDAGK